jgi:hypothetical protein
MVRVQVVPLGLASVAEDVDKIGAALQEANAVAASRTSSILPAGADEVSAAVTPLFINQSRIYRELLAEGQLFEQRFVQLLSAAAASYTGTEQAALQALRDAVGELEAPLASFAAQAENPPPTSIPPLNVPQNSSVALIVGGTTFPLPDGKYVGSIMTNFLDNPALSPLTGGLGQSLYTPEQFWPFTPQLGNLTLGQSVSQGVQLLNTAINTELSAGNNVVVYGTSQSSLLATVEIRNLMAMGSPHVGELSFFLTGNPNTPDGGFFERFPGLYIPLVDVLFNGATPPNSPYHTVIFSNQYDMVTNWPKYVLNPVSDLNAFMGFALFHGTHDYVDLTPGQIANAIELPTSPGYTGETRYYELLTQNLPLVAPLRLNLPAPYGNALADLLQPDLRVIVDMGYGSGEYADIPTPASLFELPNPFTIVPDLLNGAVQGPQAALVDLGILPQSMMPTGYPFNPVLDPGLNFPLPQSSVTGVSLLTGFEGRLMRALGLVPSWDS